MSRSTNKALVVAVLSLAVLLSVAASSGVIAFLGRWFLAAPAEIVYAGPPTPDMSRTVDDGLALDFTNFGRVVVRSPEAARVHVERGHEGPKHAPFTRVAVTYPERTIHITDRGRSNGELDFDGRVVRGYRFAVDSGGEVVPLEGGIR